MKLTFGGTEICRNRRPGSPRRTRKERRSRGTKLAAAQAFSTTAIPRTRIEDIDRVALQTRITDGTIVLTDKKTNRTLTISEIKGSDSDSNHRLCSRIS
ncbi:hypothetical protein H4Q26_006206 [Puccinia striiformis f. sp. tritici PST-130]|nr:hypothetical protein H4Q26_006206 [Puccinia striiformis f. sp. tritici PST-130]